MDEDERYIITPKGVACLALFEAGLIYDVMDERVDTFWDLFTQYLIDHHYLECGD